MTRRRFLRGGLAAVGMLGGVAAYARYWERLAVEVTRVELAIGLTRPLRVAVLGDIHLDPFFEVGYVERVVGIVNALTPDLILHTGDFVSHTADRVDELGRVLARLTPRAGHLAILGNHDHWVDAERVTAALTAAGIEVLRNRSAPVPGHHGWMLTGLESFWAGRPEPGVIDRAAADTRHIVLAHEPDAFDALVDARIALQLSGHTHGGQVRVPGYGALSLPRWGKRYQMGAFRAGRRQLYVHRGLGTVDDHVRLNCRPEIALLTLR
jgi:predicted MPP superfamily phosphohydrolase